MTPNRTRQRLTALAGLSSLLFIAPVHGQNALGAGDTLDHNLGVGSGGKNGPRIQPNFNDRNLIITGDVAGGRQFRGIVGYSAPEDFRAPLGSNDTFNFRSGSAYSDPALFRLGTTFEQLRYGQDLGLLEYRRTGSGDPASVNDAQTPVQFSSSVAGQRLDRTSMALSSTAAFQVFAEPRVVGLVYGKGNQPQFYSASPLRGLTLEQASQNISTIGLSIYDAARIRQDVEAGAAPAKLGNPYQIDFGIPEPGEPATNPLDTEKPKANLEPISPDYQRLVQKIADRYAERTGKTETPNPSQLNPQVVSRLTKDYQTLTNELITDVRVGPQPPGTPESSEAVAASTGIQKISPGAPTAGATASASTGSGAQPGQIPTGAPGAPAPGIISTAAPGSAAVVPSGPPRNATAAANQKPSTTDPRFPKPTTEGPGAPTAGTTGSQTPGTTGTQQPGAEQPAQAPAATLEDFGIVLHHGERIEHLSAGTPDRFNELLANGEQKLREGDYFAAERSFDRALRFTPGHPMAMVGAAHAQLGAGLYLSCAYSLRNLFSKQPEMIDVTYAAELLPNSERMDAAVAALKDRLRDQADRDSHGFLLAYIGHLRGDRVLVEQGLGAWAQADRTSKLLPLVRSIWLAQPASQTAPPANPEK